VTATLYTTAEVGEPSFYVSTAVQPLAAVVNLDGIRGRQLLRADTPADLRRLAQVILDAADELERKQIALGGSDA
jgi:hypothetical protein